VPTRAYGHKKQDERQEADFYPTPDRLALASCKAVKEIVPAPDFIIEPSAGAGAYVRAARETWGRPRFGLHAVEIRREERDGLIASGADIVHICPLEEYLPKFLPPARTVVVGNPPYSIAEKHVQLLLDYLLPGSFIAFLLKLGFLGTKKRAEGIWKEEPTQCHYIWPILGRPSFITSDTGSTSDVNEYAMFIWEVGYRGPPIIRFPHIRWKTKEKS
jgi:hypothetical protein